MRRGPTRSRYTGALRAARRMPAGHAHGSGHRAASKAGVDRTMSPAGDLLLGMDAGTGGVRAAPAAARLGEVYTTGGASRSDGWVQVRADATGRISHRPACPQSFLGVGVLAARGIIEGELGELVGQMVRIEKSFVPQAPSRARYEERFQRFCAEVTRRGCL